jgi:hypothetical protein
MRGVLRKNIKKVCKIAYIAFKIICKEGAKFLWTHCRVFLAVSLSSLIFIALGYKEAAFVLIMFYGMLLFWKIILLYLWD